MKPYKEIKIQRLYHGFASVRDYQVDEAKLKGQALKIILGREYIIVPIEKLDKHFKNDDVFVSKHDRRTYTLVDFDWATFKPKQEAEQLGFDLFNSLNTINNYKTI